MKINMYNHLEKDTLLSHIVLDGLTNALGADKKFEKFLEKYKTKKGHVLKVKFLVEDMEIDLQKFVDHWQNQIERMVAEKAKELIEKRFCDINYTLNDLEERVKKEIAKRLEEWEKSV